MMAKFCKYCGGTIDSDSVFCEHCGADISKKDAASIPEPQKAPAPKAPEPETPIQTAAAQPPTSVPVEAVPIEPTAVESAPIEAEPVTPAPEATLQQSKYTEAPSVPDNTPPADKAKTAKPKKKLGLIIGIAAGAVVLAAVLFVFLFLLPSLPKEYTLYNYSMGETLGDWIYVKSSVEGTPIPVKLTVTGSTAELTDPQGDIFATMEFDKKAQTGVFRFAEYEQDTTVSVVVDKDTLTVTGDIMTLEYRINDHKIPESFSGDYVIRNVTSDPYNSYSRFVTHCINEGLDVPAHFTIKSTEKSAAQGSITAPDGTETAQVTLDFDSMSGKCEYAGGDKFDLFFCVDDTTLRIYTLGEGCAYYFSKPDAIDFSAVKGDYVLDTAVASDHFDLIEYWTENSMKMPDKLTLKEDHTGSIFFSDGNVFADFSVDAKSMTGTINYAKSSDQNDIFVTLTDDTVTIYDYSVDFCYVYTGTQPVDLSEQAGDYVLTEWSDDDHPDYIEYIENTKKSIPSQMTLKADGTGIISYADGSSFADFTVNPGAMSCEVSYTIDKDKDTANILVKDNTIRLEEYEYGRTYVFRKSDPGAFDTAAGDYALIKFTKDGDDDVNKTSTLNNLKLISNMSFTKDGKGKIYYSDGKTHCEFKLDPATMTGTATDHDGSSFKMFAVIDNDRMTLYYGWFTLAFSKDAKSILREMDSGYGKLISYQTKDGTKDSDLYEARVDVYSGTITLYVKNQSKVDKTKPLSYHPWAVLKGDIDYSNMKIKFGRVTSTKASSQYEPFDAFVEVNGNILTICDPGNDVVYQYQFGSE